MAIFGAITTVYAQPTGAMANFLVAALFLWVVFFSNTWSIMPWTVSAEISSAPLREKTLAIGAWSGFGVGLAIGFVVPYMQNAEYGNLGGKIAFVWMGFSIVSGIWVYFFVPELKNRSLEEVDYMYAAGVSVRQFGAYDTTELLEQKKREHGTAEDMVGKPIDGDEKDLKHVGSHIAHLEHA